jgi:hypothetical protein
MGAVSGTGAGDGAGIDGGACVGGTLGGVWGLCWGGDVQLISVPTIASNIRILVMTLLILEALGALLLLVLIVWWTMFAGRSKGELRAPATDDPMDDTKK